MDNIKTLAWNKCDSAFITFFALFFSCLFPSNSYAINDELEYCDTGSSSYDEAICEEVESYYEHITVIGQRPPSTGPVYLPVVVVGGSQGSGGIGVSSGGPGLGSAERQREKCLETAQDLYGPCYSKRENASIVAFEVCAGLAAFLPSNALRVSAVAACGYTRREASTDNQNYCLGEVADAQGRC
ncbi:hypothetical protein OE749_02295 [Aestuariibacter sp. AA17]|uniref:DUF4189 domain-containing protein n=1 Tax=Fluctibacter corallii TaxID=2984329 RepID=A0ABT3A4J4_9ALTE|nr:hypothetical protein [Aestuariibacter sp. AA17]MCV2883528.1 hypothetical protein [Aestuariibacter sp. AA17]